jgi:hypothetical protein
MGTIRDLPPEFAAKFMACLEEIEGKYRVKDMEAFLALIAQYGPKFPFLRDLVTLNQDALTKHYDATGEIPLGVRLVQTITREGSNVVELKVTTGKSKDE